MHSNEKEMVTFHKPRFARGNIETWLNHVQDEMGATLKKLMKDGNKDYSTGGTEWPRKKFVMEKKG